MIAGFLIGSAFGGFISYVLFAGNNCVCTDCRRARWKMGIAERITVDSPAAPSQVARGAGNAKSWKPGGPC